MNINYRQAILILLLSFALCAATFAQKQDANLQINFPTEFTYQGRLTDNSLTANGNYDFEFKLVDGNGAVIATQQLLNVAVSNGVFTVRLDFGATPFVNLDGRFLEIGVRPNGTAVFITLAPRQPITSTPYALMSFASFIAQSANQANDALSLGGVAANQYVLTTDTRLSDARNPLPGSNNYIQNTTDTQPASFTVSGIGSAEILNARAEYRLLNSRFIHVTGISNTFVGYLTGDKITTGQSDSFFGIFSGLNNTTGSNNSFFGTSAGQNNTTGNNNSFFGASSGKLGSTGDFNSFFGALTGSNNTTGAANSFFGQGAGLANTTGHSNTFLGVNAGAANTQGYINTFVGGNAGGNNTTGADNVFIGYLAGSSNTTGISNIFIGNSAGTNSSTGNNNIAIGGGTTIANGVTNSIVIGNSASVSVSNRIVLGITSQNTLISGFLMLPNLDGAGTTQLCRTLNNTVGQCSSSIRYKTNVENFTSGLDLIRRLRPVSFTWKDGGIRDLGFIAEEVGAIEPLMTTTNEKGEIEGVKYDRITTALVNAVNEQQAQIERQQEQIRALTKLVCAANPSAEICAEKELKK